QPEEAVHDRLEARGDLRRELLALRRLEAGRQLRAAAAVDGADRALEVLAQADLEALAALAVLRVAARRRAPADRGHERREVGLGHDDRVERLGAAAAHLGGVLVGEWIALELLEGP